MITVIIAGGSGTRLWPLSTSSNPKQLLKLINDKSMVQNTYERAKRMGQDIYVVPDVSHADALKDQLVELTEDAFVVEPGRKGTANCIIAALAHISKRHSHDEPIAFVHSDHAIRDAEGQAITFKEAAKKSTETGAIVLVGVEPTYPSTGFGYIERGASDGDAYKVNRFKEKPDFESAKSYFEAGNYLWNCGYFVGSVDTFTDKMTKYAPELKRRYDALVAIDDEHSDEYSNTYQTFESEPIDTALIEKTEDLLVVPASFDWMDIGNFKDLHEAVQRDQTDNYQYGQNIHVIDVENTYIRNEEDKPIAVIGLDNVVVVNTPDGLLVARKDVSHHVGDIAKKVQA